MSFQSCDWIMYVIVSVHLRIDKKNWIWPPVHLIWCLMKLFIYFVFNNTRIDIDWESCVTFNTLKYGIRNSPAYIDISWLTNHMFLQKLLKIYSSNIHLVNKIGTPSISYALLFVLLYHFFILLPKISDWVLHYF